VFEGPLAPVVMVAPVGGSSAGGAGFIPWRCAIDSFTGEEEVPQVRFGWDAGRRLGGCLEGLSS